MGDPRLLLVDLVGWCRVVYGICTSRNTKLRHQVCFLPSKSCQHLLNFDTKEATRNLQVPRHVGVCNVPTTHSLRRQRLAMRA